ncbi:hypothetical protein BHE74_00018922 [Ensete ventricosum]|nr:hypothetical protein GW17_00043657 [Ensete ventricosum]RWW73220.1 hypothetical protein BHE74_00018922 [Ensete ventricosum]
MSIHEGASDESSIVPFQKTKPFEGDEAFDASSSLRFPRFPRNDDGVAGSASEGIPSKRKLLTQLKTCEGGWSLCQAENASLQGKLFQMMADTKKLKVCACSLSLSSLCWISFLVFPRGRILIMALAEQCFEELQPKAEAQQNLDRMCDGCPDDG